MALKQIFTSYDTTEFFPVYEDGQLQNKGEFVAYKADKLLHAVGHAAAVGLAASLEAGRVIVEHIAAEP